MKRSAIHKPPCDPGETTTKPPLKTTTGFFSSEMSSRGGAASTGRARRATATRSAAGTFMASTRAEKAEREALDRLEEVGEHLPGQEQAEQGEHRLVEELPVAPGHPVAHEHGQDGAAVQGRNRQEIEDEEQEVQQEQDADRHQGPRD